MDKREEIRRKRFNDEDLIMATLIFDAAPLIQLGKIRILEKLDQLKAKKIIPRSVYEEVVEKGKLIGHEDAIYVKQLVDKGFFTVIEVEEPIKDYPTTSLSAADNDVLSLAKEKEGFAVIDEDAGRKVAEVMGIKTLGSVGILFNLLESKAITKKEMRELIDLMIENGWYCSTDLYSFIVGKLE